MARCASIRDQLQTRATRRARRRGRRGVRKARRGVRARSRRPRNRNAFRGGARRRPRRVGARRRVRERGTLVPGVLPVAEQDGGAGAGAVARV